MAWVKQENRWARRLCPDDTMSFTVGGINIGRAAFEKTRLARFGSADVLLDLDSRPKKLAVQLHANGRGEFKISQAKRGTIANIGCGSVMTDLRKAGILPGRYHYRLDKPEFLVFDLDVATRIGG